MPPRFADFGMVETALRPDILIEALRQGFQAGCSMPPRQQHAWGRSREPDATLLIMPAWQPDGPMAVKLVSVVPGNARRAQPTVMPIVVAFDAQSGRPSAVMDGHAVTLNRTAAASALASTYLSREDSKRLVVMGTGALSTYLVRAHCTTRPIEHVTIWGRDHAKATRVALSLQPLGIEVEASADAEAAVGRADIVSCATFATDPILRGAWVSPGTHVDLVGSYQPHMRETDDALMAKARIFADMREAALSEPGDILLPLETGAIKESDVLGDLFGLARGIVRGRLAAQDITVFKSVGIALEDLIAARLVSEHFA